MFFTATENSEATSLRKNGILKLISKLGFWKEINMPLSLYNLEYIWYNSLWVNLQVRKHKYSSIIHNIWLGFFGVWGAAVLVIEPEPRACAC
jgi:hypothetical protein